MRADFTRRFAPGRRRSASRPGRESCCSRRRACRFEKSPGASASTHVPSCCGGGGIETAAHQSLARCAGSRTETDDRWLDDRARARCICDETAGRPTLDDPPPRQGDGIEPCVSASHRVSRHPVVSRREPFTVRSCAEVPTTSHHSSDREPPPQHVRTSRAERARNYAEQVGNPPDKTAQIRE